VGRAAAGTMWGDIDVSTLYHTVWIYDSAGNFKQVLLEEKQNTTTNFSIAPGNYVFYVEAYSGAGREKADLKAVGSSGTAPVQIKSGSNGAIPIHMHAPTGFPAEVTITGNCWVGQTLTAIISPALPIGGTLTYEWTRDTNADVIGRNRTYTLVNEDAGKTIYLELSHSGYTGEIPVPSVKIASGTFTVSTEGAWNAAVTAIDEGGADKAYAIIVNGNFSLPGIDVTANTFSAANVEVAIQGNNHTITLSSNGSLLRVGADQSVTMTNLNLHGQGTTVNNNAALVYVGGTGSAFTLSGGAISGNTGNVEGGGVYVFEGGTFTMSSGEVSGNASSYTGGSTAGGVWVYGGAFTMSGGKVSGNTSTANLNASGGGVVVDNNGAFTMTGGEVSGNTASNNGGGVLVQGGTFHMINGTVYGNTESNAALRNTVTSTTGEGAALNVSSPGTAECGDGTALSTTDDTIRVTNGVLQ
jgi:hypothetical protein